MKNVITFILVGIPFLFVFAMIASIVYAIQSVIGFSNRRKIQLFSIKNPDVKVSCNGNEVTFTTSWFLHKKFSRDYNSRL